MTQTYEFPQGFRLLSAYFDRASQEALLAHIREVVTKAPLFQPRMPRTNAPLSVRMSNCGSLGWVADKNGYRYQPDHPDTGEPWPEMPKMLLDLWEGVSGYEAPPQACLINWYDGGAKMGLHQDKDEENLVAPVVSVSLGDTGVFRLGGLTRKAPTRSMKLSSGDVVVLGGASRLCYHGIDRIMPGTSTLLRQSGRINLTLRRVTPL
ncbi:alpha-ketoglutarate-dependent dioxygenase AlkB [Rhodobacteraceae bacterium RKSG542]|uniref:alpha-ketoglutarate-dependent dioxygenase AlkB n=1 Tax=Pseudovibrio flavus TaxID=2529854 RepID=UPI003527B2AC|nr:alpha-ketoglutarate-dependent dioxygenase AlkB [Pseudovibrio flavus]